VNTYLNDPDTIPVVVNTIVLIINYGMLILIKLLLNDRTVYFINTWEQMRYLMIYLVLMTAINYCKVVLINKYIYLVSQEKVRKLHIYRSNVIEIQRLEKEMKKERGIEKRHKLRDERDAILLECYNRLSIF
jgi:hypothetical protein